MHYLWSFWQGNKINKPVTLKRTYTHWIHPHLTVPHSRARTVSNGKVESATRNSCPGAEDGTVAQFWLWLGFFAFPSSWMLAHTHLVWTTGFIKPSCRSREPEFVRFEYAGKYSKQPGLAIYDVPKTQNENTKQANKFGNGTSRVKRAVVNSAVSRHFHFGPKPVTPAWVHLPDFPAHTRVRQLQVLAWPSSHCKGYNLHTS